MNTLTTNEVLFILNLFNADPGTSAHNRRWYAEQLMHHPDTTIKPKLRRLDSLYDATHPDDLIKMRCMVDNYKIIEMSKYKDVTQIAELKDRMLRLSAPVYMHMIHEGFDMPVYFQHMHWANGKTPVELGLAEYR